MKFRKSTAYALVSECAEYSIAKVIVQGLVQYEAWYTAKGVQPKQIAARKSSSLDCIAACRQHAEQSGKAA